MWTRSEGEECTDEGFGCTENAGRVERSAIERLGHPSFVSVALAVGCMLGRGAQM